MLGKCKNCLALEEELHNVRTELAATRLNLETTERTMQRTIELVREEMLLTERQRGKRNEETAT